MFGFNIQEFTILLMLHFCVIISTQVTELESSAIPSQPGLIFVPQPPKENFERTLIWLNSTNFKSYTDELDKFLEEYKAPGLIAGRGENLFNCDYNHPAPEGKICDVDVRRFTPCTSEHFYNYHRYGPCVFLQLKNIKNWTPQFYNKSSELPNEMPNNLKAHISHIEKLEPHSMNTVWVSCEGETPADLEFIGPTSYYPKRGFPGYYFPIKNDYYINPLVAVSFQRPQTGVIINIECKMWAKNIIYDREKSLGSVQFQLLLD